MELNVPAVTHTRPVLSEHTTNCRRAGANLAYRNSHLPRARDATNSLGSEQLPVLCAHILRRLARSKVPSHCSEMPNVNLSAMCAAAAAKKRKKQAGKITGGRN